MINNFVFYHILTRGTYSFMKYILPHLVTRYIFIHEIYTYEFGMTMKCDKMCFVSLSIMVICLGP